MCIRDRPNILLSLSKEKIKIDVPEFELSDPFLQSQLNAMLPNFSREFLLAGKFKNLTGIFSSGGEYLLSSNFTDIKLQDRLRAIPFRA